MRSVGGTAQKPSVQGGNRLRLGLCWSHGGSGIGPWAGKLVTERAQDTKTATEERDGGQEQRLLLCICCGPGASRRLTSSQGACCPPAAVSLLRTGH